MGPIGGKNPLTRSATAEVFFLPDQVAGLFLNFRDDIAAPQSSESERSTSSCGAKSMSDDQCRPIAVVVDCGHSAVRDISLGSHSKKIRMDPRSV